VGGVGGERRDNEKRGGKAETGRVTLWAMNPLGPVKGFSFSVGRLRWALRCSADFGGGMKGEWKNLCRGRERKKKERKVW
jgi:hypothetical protein